MLSTLCKMAADAAVPAALLFGAPAVIPGDVVDPSTPPPAGVDPILWLGVLTAVNLAVRFGGPLLYKLAVAALRAASERMGKK